MRHDPDDRSALASQYKRLTNHLWIAAETPPPQAVTQDHNWSGACCVFFECEGATERRRDAERSKQISGNDPGGQSLWGAVSGEVDSIGSVSGDLFKCFRLVTPLQKIQA